MGNSFNKDKEPGCPILELNDDCLLSIFEYLTLANVFKISTISPRFENILKLSKAIKQVDIKSFSKIELKYFEEIVPKIGNCIERFIYSFSDLKYFDIISQHCSNLRGLTMTRHDEQIISQITKFKKITDLSLNSFCTYSELKILSEISSIQHLDLFISDFKFTGPYLDKFKNLKSLKLKFNRSIQPSSVMNLCLNVKKIKELDIVDCHDLNNSFFNALVKNCEELEVLAISGFYEAQNVHIISELKNLKCLKIDMQYRNDLNSTLEEILKNVAVKKKNNINVLKIKNFEYNDEISKAILKFTNLKQLDMTGWRGHTISCICSEVFVTNISNLSNLKILNLHGTDHSFYFSQRSKENQIIATTPILTIIKKLPHLETINLTEWGYCNNDFLKKVIEILKQMCREKPLTLVMGKTNVSPFILKLPFVIENKKILKIDYDGYLNPHRF